MAPIYPFRYLDYVSSLLFAIAGSSNAQAVPSFFPDNKKVEILTFVILMLFFPLSELYSQEKVKSFRISTTYNPEVAVTAGEQVTIEARGKIVLGLFAGAAAPGGIEGYRSYNIDPYSKHGALLFKIGNSRYTAMTAPTITFSAKESGPILFVVNDKDPSNNSGFFDVKVSVGSASAGMATNNKIRKNGFVYKSDTYWERLGNDPVFRNVFEGNFQSVFKNESFESLFTSFIENYSENCAKHITQKTPVVIKVTETRRDAYGSSYSTTYDGSTFQVDSKVADTFINYLNKQSANGVSDFIGAFANNPSSSPTAGDLLGDVFREPVNALLNMKNFFNTEVCDCATMKQMRDNMYRFALDQNSLQEDNQTVPGAEKETHH